MEQQIQLIEQQLRNLEQQILALPTEYCTRITKMYNTSIIRFRRKTQKEKGNVKYNKRYSREEKDAIKFMTEKGSTDEEIAQHLERSVKGVIQQRQKLISVENPALATQLVSNWSPSNADPSFIIPQHTNG